MSFIVNLEGENKGLCRFTNDSVTETLKLYNKSFSESSVYW